MRRFQTYAAALLFAGTVFLTACGGKKEMLAGTIAEQELKTETDSSGTGEATEQTKADFTEAGESGTQNADPIRPLALLAGSGTSLFWDGSDSEALPDLSCPIVELGEAEQARYPALAETLEAVRETRENGLRLQLERVLSDSSVQVGNEADSFARREIAETVSVRRADTSVVSLMFETVVSQGTEEEVSAVDAVTIDTQTGRELALSEVVTDVSALTEAVCEVLSECSAPEADRLKNGADGEQSVREALEQGAWLLENQGLTVFILSEENGGDPEKRRTVTLSFAQYPDLVKKEYQRVPERWGCELSLERDCYVDLDGDGSLHRLLVSGEKTEYGDYQAQTIWLDGVPLTETLYAFTLEPMLWHLGEGKTFLWMENVGPSDYRTISIYDLSGGAAERIGEADGARVLHFDAETGASLHEVLSDPDAFDLVTRTFLLGTYDGVRSYQLGEDGTLKEKEECFRILPEDGREILFTVRTPFFMDLIDGTGTVRGTTELLTGAELSYDRTDHASFADVRLPDGQLGRLWVSTDSTNGAVLVNGMPLEEVLDGVRFAG